MKPMNSTISHFTSHEITYRYNVPVPLFVIEVKQSKTTWFCTLWLLRLITDCRILQFESLTFSVQYRLRHIQRKYMVPYMCHVYVFSFIIHVNSLLSWSGFWSSKTDQWRFKLLMLRILALKFNQGNKFGDLKSPYLVYLMWSFFDLMDNKQNIQGMASSYNVAKKKQSASTIFRGKYSALKIQMRYIQNPC